MQRIMNLSNQVLTIILTQKMRSLLFWVKQLRLVFENRYFVPLISKTAFFFIKTSLYSYVFLSSWAVFHHKPVKPSGAAF